MTKKRGVVFGIIIIVLIAGLLYFKSLRLSDLVNENQYIIITYDELGVKNGLPDINNKTYDEITEVQKNKIIDLLKQYSYKRTFGTIFSDGSLSELSNKMVYIFIYENKELVNEVFISDSGHISVNGKSYILKKSSVFIDQLLDIINK